MSAYATTLEPTYDLGLLESDGKSGWMIKGDLKDFQLANCIGCPSADQNAGTGIPCCTLCDGPIIKNNRCKSKYENIRARKATDKRRRDKWIDQH